MSTLKKIPLESILNRHLSSLSPVAAEFAKDLLRLIGERDINLATLLNQGLSFASNFDATELSFTTNAIPDTQDTVAHGRKSAPAYFLVVDINKGGVLYRSAAFNATNCYFKCTVASAAVKVIVF